MRAALTLLLGVALFAGPALAGAPGDGQGVTILRGSSAPPPPPPPPEPAPPVVVQPQIVYESYPVYTWPGFAVPGVFGPGFVVTTPHRHMHPAPPPSTIPSGWPLLNPPPRR